MSGTTARVAVVGGGVGGATAALRLRQAGLDVVLFEAGPNLGGLVTSFEVAGTPLECFYHHVFPHEYRIAALVDEMGLADRLEWFSASMGVYAGARVWPFTTPFDLLAFRPLPLRDRLRTGIAALRLPRTKRWERLDRVPAVEWLTDATSPRVTDLIWRPLLGQKFGPVAEEVPAAWMYGRFVQRAGARRNPLRPERLGYLRGGFRQLFDRLHGRLVEDGVDVRLGQRASAIATDGDRVTGVVAGEPVETDAVVFAGTLPNLPPLLDARHVDPRWSAHRGMGAVCVIVELARPLQDVYWVNVCDPGLPFGGVIEHTNLVPAADYQGRHVVYLSRYFTAEEPIATADLDIEKQRWVALLAERMGMRGGDVLDVHAFRTPYAAPLVTLGYLEQIPPMRAELGGLYVTTTAQIYPQDRGMDEGVKGGEAVAEMVVADLQQGPAARP